MATQHKAGVIDIESNGIYLSYQMLFLLVGGLISLGITVSVWNSYASDIEENRITNIQLKNDIENLKNIIDEKYHTLDEKIYTKNKEALSKIDERYKSIKTDVKETNERYKDWIKSNSRQLDEVREEQVKLKYTKANK